MLTSNVCRFQLFCILIVTDTAFSKKVFSHSDRSVVASHCGINFYFLMSNGIKHIFMYLFALCYSPFCPFLHGLLVFLLLSFEPSLHNGYKFFIKYVICTCFSVCGLSFHFFHSILPRAEVYNIDEGLFS